MTAVDPSAAPSAGPVLSEEVARGEIAAIIAMADDGTDMLDEIMAGPVDALVRDARARVVHELLGTADRATGNWVLGDAASVVHTALVGAAHELDHPDCEDSTIAHLAEWRVAVRVAAGRIPPGAVAALFAAHLDGPS